MTHSNIVKKITLSSLYNSLKATINHHTVLKQCPRQEQVRQMYNLRQSIEDPRSEEFVLEVALDRRRRRLPGDGHNLQNKLPGTRVFD